MFTGDIRLIFFRQISDSINNDWYSYAKNQMDKSVLTNDKISSEAMNDYVNDK